MIDRDQTPTARPTHAATRADQGGHSTMVCKAMAGFKRKLAELPENADERDALLADAEQWEAGA